jgi:hypothetical protein
MLGANNLSEVVNDATARTNIGLGTAAVANTGDFDAAGVSAAGIAAHVAAGDPHSQYLTPAESDAAYAALVHATRHKSGGADAIALDTLAVPTDITTLNASTSAHGLLQKLPGGTANFLRADGAFAAPPGGGAGATRGTATIDFGPFPGTSEAVIAVGGQASILATSDVQAYIMADDTSGTHTANDHRVAAALMSLTCGTPVASTGFSIYGRCADKMQGTFFLRWVWAD